MGLQRHGDHWLWVGGPVPPGSDAITIWSVVSVRRACADSRHLLRHEEEHVRQWHALGVFGSSPGDGLAQLRDGVQEVLRADVVDRVEADTGATIWSGQFDTGIVGLPAAQDDAVNRIAGALGSRLVDTEARRVEREHPGDADVVDLMLRARSILNLPQNAERNESENLEDPGWGKHDSR